MVRRLCHECLVSGVPQSSFHLSRPNLSARSCLLIPPFSLLIYIYTYIHTYSLAAILFVFTCFLYLRKTGFDIFVFASLIYIALMALMVGMLAFYHTQLMAVNLTTNEHHNFARYDYMKVGR